MQGYPGCEGKGRWASEEAKGKGGEVKSRVGDISMHEVSSESSEILSSQTFGRPSTENCLPWEATGGRIAANVKISAHPPDTRLLSSPARLINNAACILRGKTFGLHRRLAE